MFSKLSALCVQESMQMTLALFYQKPVYHIKENATMHVCLPDTNSYILTIPYPSQGPYQTVTQKTRNYTNRGLPMQSFPVQLFDTPPPGGSGVPGPRRVSGRAQDTARGGVSDSVLQQTVESLVCLQQISSTDRRQLTNSAICAKLSQFMQIRFHIQGQIT